MKNYTINEFTAGEVVYLKSDFALAMTVSKVDVDEDLVRCFWRDKKTNKSVNEAFPPTVLCKESDKPRPTVRFHSL